MKKSLVALVSVSLLVLAGCGANNSSSNSSSSSSSQTSVKKENTDYQKLSSSDKKKIKFDLTSVKDKDDNNYDVSMTINNKSKKNVSFDPTQFSLLVDGVQRATSDEDDKVTVKAVQQITIDELFEDVSADVLNGENITVEYINKKNIVAKPSFNITTDSASDETAETTNSSNDSQETAATSSTNQAPQDNRVVKRADQAADLFRRATGSWGGYIDATETNGGWQINDTDSGESIGFVSYAGDTTADSNGTTTYDEMLHAEQNGGPVKP
ncbi:hypothetical protein [Companilactobacillus furfuricola]|uniref:hypothetical protein n=1 Tax=Companilactobacillus furfuricola TaxID=1462575 RepID=UPI000F7885E0|nr:hypothetical protein [Companilactobacillus furfuricola]